MSVKRLRRTAVPLLVGLTVAGTMTFSAGTASAGAWFDTGYYFPQLSDCNSWASDHAAIFGWTAWDCRWAPNVIPEHPWDLWAFEA